MNVKEIFLQGTRKYQEDSLLVVKERGLFIVSDGMGGYGNGDIASSIVTEETLLHFQRVQKETDLVASLTAMSVKIQDRLQQAFLEEPSYQNMGATLAGLFIGSKIAFSFHAGDSRIYHIKSEAQVYWNTKDHSTVQQLFDAGILKSEEEMENDPRRNQVNNVFQANLERKAVKLTVNCIAKIDQNDIFVVCSDGLIKSFKTSSELLTILANASVNFQGKHSTTKSHCELEATDNCSAIFIEASDSFENLSCKSETQKWTSTAPLSVELNSIQKLWFAVKKLLRL